MCTVFSVGMEVEIRFGASLHTMESELHRMLEKVSLSSSVHIDSYLRPKKSEFALISMVSTWEET